MGKIKQLDDETAKLYNPKEIITFASQKPFEENTINDIISSNMVDLETLEKLSSHFTTIATNTNAPLSEFL